MSNGIRRNKRNIGTKVKIIQPNSPFHEREGIVKGFRGDWGTLPDVYFVSVSGSVKMITTEFTEAFYFWDRVSRKTKMQTETCLENRCYGVIASVEPKDDGSSKHIRLDPPKKFLDRLEY
jgi:hypothetical protein